MKNLILSVFFILFFPCLSFAHSGSLDENGGHYDRSTGEYHYHHGFSAHQHINGECPYDFEDKSNINSSSNTKHENSEKDNNNNFNIFDTYFLPIYISISVVITIFIFNNNMHSSLGCLLFYILIYSITAVSIIFSSFIKIVDEFISVPIICALIFKFLFWLSDYIVNVKRTLILILAFNFIYIIFLFINFF